MTNVNSMSGVEFELFCKQLLEKNGFTVSTTATTGDGGIDLIAISNNVFYKGKYIIQCKRYIGSVGEPVIRDLYGVVMAERANKGILITTGTFTNSAITFSKGKQIELIDGDSLNKIIEIGQYSDLSSNTTISIFDDKKYNYYLEQIENKQADCSTYYNFLKFIMSYIIDPKAEKKQEKRIMDLFETGENSDKLTIISEINNINQLIALDFDSICNSIIPNIEMVMSKLATCKDCKSRIGKAFFQLLDFKYNGIKQLLHFDLAEFISSRLNYLCTSNYTRPWYNSCFILSWAERNPTLLNTCEIRAYLKTQKSCII